MTNTPIKDYLNTLKKTKIKDSNSNKYNYIYINYTFLAALLTLLPVIEIIDHIQKVFFNNQDQYVAYHNPYFLIIKYLGLFIYCFILEKGKPSKYTISTTIALTLLGLFKHYDKIMTNFNLFYYSLMSIYYILAILLFIKHAKNFSKEKKLWKKVLKITIITPLLFIIVEYIYKLFIN